MALPPEEEGQKAQESQPGSTVGASNIQLKHSKTDKTNVIVGIQNMKMLEAKKSTVKNPRQAPKSKTSVMHFGYASDKKESNSSILAVQNPSNSPGKNIKVVVPSFGTCSALFSQHFSILRELKKKIEKYKNMFEEQKDEETSWNCLENIMKVLETALAFLNFPIQTSNES